MRRHFDLWRIVLIGLLVLTFAAFGCGDDDDDDSTPSDDDDDDDNDTTVDSMTSASPGKDAIVLTSAHNGYGQAGCISCHAGAHLDGFAEGQCAACHGNNGAPLRSAGHDNSDCLTCHTGQHSALGFTEHQCSACHQYESTSSCPASEDVDVVVIGAGGGGLAAAVTLAQSGLSVALIEKHYKVGGYMSRFNRGDYEFEISLHATAMLNENDPSGNLVRLGILDRLEPVKSDPMYYAYFPGKEFVVPANIEDYRNSLKAKFPEEAAGIDALIDQIYSTDELLDVVMRLVDDFNFADLMIILSNFGDALQMARTLFVDLHTAVTEHVSDPELVGLWEQLIVFLGGGPSDLQALFFNAMLTGYFFDGYYYLTGGSQAITQALGDVFEENGGKLYLNTLATEIVIEDGKAVMVKTKDGACFNTRYVVSNANAPDTLINMVGEEYLPADYVSDLNEMEICGATTLQIFMGVDKDYSAFFKGCHEIFHNESFDQDENMDFVFNDDPYMTPYIIANYSVVDDTVAPAGKNVLVMSTYLPYEYQNTWGWLAGYSSYNQAKELVAKIYIDRMEEYLPDLGEHIEVLEVGTPVTNQLFTNNPIGSIYGWSNTPSQGTIRRLKQQTPIDNLYLAGAWTFPGGGQSTVIDSGVSTADMILEVEGLK